MEAILEAWTLPGAPEELRERVARMQRRAFELQAGAAAAEAPDPLDDHPELLSGSTSAPWLRPGSTTWSISGTARRRSPRRSPARELVQIEAAGHLAPLEQPDAFSRLPSVPRLARRAELQP